MKLAALLLMWASPDECARCHLKQTEAFGAAGMTRALARVTAPTSLNARIGGFRYQISGSEYAVSDGKETLRVPLQWAFGQGKTGQTYLFERGGRWYESRVSYYAELKGLDVTLGMQSIPVHTVEEAAGRLTSNKEAGECFGCHATGVVRSPALDLSRMVAGVQCERCHGSTTEHVGKQAPMKKLTALTAEGMSEACGECHRTWAQIAADGPRGIQNIRFQPYRLANSKCYDGEDRRIRCTACHDPHRPLEVNAAAYDGRCTACHSAKAVGTKASRHLCKKATKDCASCHMPKLALPGAHKEFADHWIRVVKGNEGYPD